MTEAHLNGNGHAPTTATDASKLSKESIALKEQVRAMDEKLAERLKRKPPVRALPPALTESRRYRESSGRRRRRLRPLVSLPLRCVGATSAASGTEWQAGHSPAQTHRLRVAGRTEPALS